MSVLEIVGGNDRRSMIKRYERKSKQEAIRELVDIIHCNWNQVEQLEATCETLRGLKPDCPPRPPEGEGLPRYGLRWNGPSQPISVPMDDGYWTPWHLAAAALQAPDANAPPESLSIQTATLKHIRRDLDACQKVIWLAGCRPRVPGGFDPSYVTDAQARLAEIDALLQEASHD